ncbi:MAG: hypothetical protein EHM86_11100, partial [Desulfobulbaceae bacterium]
MSVINHDSVFTSLRQNGPLATTDSVELNTPFSRRTKDWLRILRANRLNITKYRALRSQVFEFLNISDFSQIPTLLENKLLRNERSHRACTLLGNMFGVEGTTREVEARVIEYARTADAVVNSLRNKIMAPYASHIATTNEIEVTNDPVNLLLIMFDDRYHKKARFEARRKLVLMSLAGSIDQRERETQIEDKFSLFLDFLNDYVWSRKQKIGEHEIVYLLSHHNSDDFRCTDVQLISLEQANTMHPEAGTKL